MKPLLIAVLAVFFLLTSDQGSAKQTPGKDSPAQTGRKDAPSADTLTTKIQAKQASPEDDEFNLFLLVLAMAFASIILSAVVVGSLAAVFILFLVFGLVSAGIFTTSVIVGLYKRSFLAGFKALLVTVCGLGGIIAGIIILWVSNKVFSLHFSHTVTIWSGAASGLIGGILLGLSVFFIIRLLTDYFRKKLSLQI